MSEAKEPTTAEAAVRALYEDLLDAWNRRDVGAYAAFFAADGALIGFDGSQVPGSQVRDHLTPIFADHPTAAYVAKVREVRALSDGVVLVRAIVGMVPPGQTELNPEANAVQSLVAEHRSDGWRVALFQNTPAQYHGRPELVDRHTAELRRLTAGAAERA
jgi:uncharacterized protein (TIGR02246 family)